MWLTAPVLTVRVMRNLKIKLDCRRTIYMSCRVRPSAIRNLQWRAAVNDRPRRAASLLLNGQVTRHCPIVTRGDVVSAAIDQYRFIVVNNMLRRD